MDIELTRIMDVVSKKSDVALQIWDKDGRLLATGFFPGISFLSHLKEITVVVNYPLNWEDAERIMKVAKFLSLEEGIKIPISLCWKCVSPAAPHLHCQCF